MDNITVLLGACTMHTVFQAVGTVLVRFVVLFSFNIRGKILLGLVAINALKETYKAKTTTKNGKKKKKKTRENNENWQFLHL